MNIVELSIHDLVPYENNPRNNIEAVEYVANSIEEFGFKVPIVVDTNNVIVAGHTRYMASKKLGLETVPCIVADDLTEEQIKAFRLADNKVSEIATWDDELLSEEIAGIFDIDVEKFGLTFDVFDSDINDEEIDTKKAKAHYIKFDKIKIEITDDEFDLLMERFNKYVDENSVSFGFVRSLLCE